MSKSRWVVRQCCKNCGQVLRLDFIPYKFMVFSASPKLAVGNVRHHGIYRWRIGPLCLLNCCLALQLSTTSSFFCFWIVVWFGVKDLSIAVETFGKARHVDAGDPPNVAMGYNIKFLLDKQQRRLAETLNPLPMLLDFRSSFCFYESRSRPETQDVFNGSSG